MGKKSFIIYEEMMKERLRSTEWTKLREIEGEYIAIKDIN